MAGDPGSVAFVGLGIMGLPMATHIHAGGRKLHVNTRTRSKADGLIAAGAVWHDRAGDAAAGADIVITMLGNPDDVEAIYFGDDGVMARARAGAVLVDCTTSSPSLARRIHAAAAERGLASLDAPVSGGEVGASAAKLAIMVGGDEAAFQRALPVLELMGSNIVHQGGPGAGQHTKACNQIMIAGAIMGVSEGLAYAARSGLDPRKVLDLVATGAAGSFILSNLGPKMIERDYRPGFFVEHFLKDLRIASEEAMAAGLDLKGLQTALDQYLALAVDGHGRQSTHVLYEAYDPR